MLYPTPNTGIYPREPLTLAHNRGPGLGGIITYFQTYLILTNKPNFRNDKMNITIDMTSDYKIFCRSQGPKNKPNSNPIKPKTNPIKANTNPIQTQSKPIPIPSSLKDKNDDVIILRITLKNGLLRISK